MCGRFTVSKSKEEVVKFIKDHFEVENVQDFNLPRYNIGPGQDLICLVKDGEKYRAGLIPWDYKIQVNGKHKQMINARSETIDEKYSFKEAFKSKRCLIIADSFYEWDQLSKQPYRLMKKDEGLYLYAGIYHPYMLDNHKKYGALIVTTKANALLEVHHPRMPVIFDVEQAKNYLNMQLKPDEVKMMLNSYSEDKMKIYPVSKDVNSVRNDSENLIKKTTNI